MKKAFTLIELIIVIVILGILSTIGTDIYTNMYTNYATSKVINELETETEVVLEQISARLSDRVRIATIGRINATNNIVVVDDPRLTANHNVLEWIGQSVDSRDLPGANFGATIGWSGSVDLFASNRANGLVSLGSNFPSASTIINDLGGSNTSAAIIFQGILRSGDRHLGFGFIGENPDDVMIVDLTQAAANTIPGNAIGYDAAGAHITDKYYLAHTAYAIVPGAADGDGLVDDLFLHYNYRPWNGETFNSQNARREVLVKNVSMFRFRGVNGTIDLKLCLKDNTGLLRRDFIVCKTKAVF